MTSPTPIPSTSSSSSPPITSGRSRSRSLSAVVPPPTPITLPIKLSSSASPSNATSSTISAGTTGPFSPSDEFKRAFHHARSASMSSSNASASRPVDLRLNVQGSANDPLSTSPTSDAGSSTSSEDSDPKTPLSTSPVLNLAGLSLAPTQEGNGRVNTLNRKARSEPDSTIHEHDDEDDDNAQLGAGPSLSLSSGYSSAFSPLFADGARWGFPQSAGGEPPSPPNGGGSILPLRRASLGPTSPPLSSTSALSASVGSNGGRAMNMTVPLGRVSSAGAGGGGASAASGNGPGPAGGSFGIFRRMSVGGFGSRPKPPSPPISTSSASFANPVPPSSTIPAAPVGQSAPISIPPPSAPVMPDTTSTSRGRRASVGANTALGAAKPKRKISPMGERMLRGGFEMH